MLKPLIFRKLCNFIADSWRVTVVYFLFISTLVVALSFQLFSLQGGFSAAEVQYAASRLSISDIFFEPSFAPVTIVHYLLSEFPFIEPEITIRLGGVIIAVIAILGFFFLVNKWLGTKVAVLSTVLFAMSATTLSLSRIATPYTGVLLFPLFLLMCLHLKNVRSGGLAIISIVVLASLIYIPGFIWLLLAGIIWQRRQLKKTFKRLYLSTKTLALVLALTALTPLIFATVRNPAFGLDVLGLNTNVASLLEFGQNIAAALSHFFINSDAGQTYNLGSLPVFDIATLTFFVLGLVYYLKNWQLDRVKIIFVSILIFMILIGLGGSVNQFFLTGPFYIIVSSGLAYLMRVWFNVFPKNPLAKLFSLSMVIIIVAFTSIYHLQRYFIAWPRSPETRQEFNHDNLIQ